LRQSTGRVAIADWDRIEGRWLRVCEVELVRKSWCFMVMMLRIEWDGGDGGLI
jgi:hypothetical protein